MEELFSSNLFAIYIIACIAVISYTNFGENQRMFLLYLFAYATAFFQIFRVLSSVVLLMMITFVFLEYLTEDVKKLSLITKLRYKVYDYVFLMLFQYHFLWILMAFIALHISCSNDCYIQIWLKIVSIGLLFIGMHLSISQPFKIKSITEMGRVFEKIPPYSFEYQDRMQEKFNLLCDFEDKTYFQRKNSYSCITVEYAICWKNNHRIKGRGIVHKILLHSQKFPHIFRLSRGYSTPEMQLLRTVGITRGYDKYKIQRKVFEVVYAKIFFSSLKEFHQANTNLALQHYREYLLYVYFQTVMTKINGKKYAPLSSVFSNDRDVSNWSMNGLFIACLGLSFREVDDYSLELFSDIIEKYALDINRIRELNERYPLEKFPSEDRRRSP